MRADLENAIFEIQQNSFVSLETQDYIENVLTPTEKVLFAKEAMVTTGTVVGDEIKIHGRDIPGLLFITTEYVRHFSNRDTGFHHEAMRLDDTHMIAGASSIMLRSRSDVGIMGIAKWSIDIETVAQLLKESIKTQRQLLKQKIKEERKAKKKQD